MLFKTVTAVFYSVIIAVLVVIAGLVAASVLPIPGGIKLYTVQSGSMEPAIHTGSVVIVRPESSYEVGDVITFKAEEDRNNARPEVTTTHRLYAIQQAENGTVYQTKGDANDVPDGTLTTKDLVIGKTLVAVPWLGYPVNFARTQEGLIILVIIPAALIIYSELVSIKNELVLMWQKRKHKHQPADVKEVTPNT